MNYPNPQDSFEAYKIIMLRVQQLTERMNSIFETNDPERIEELEPLEEELLSTIQSAHFNLQSMENVIMMRRNSQAILTDIIMSSTPIAKVAVKKEESVVTEEIAPVIESEQTVETPEQPEEDAPETTMAELLEEEENNETPQEEDPEEEEEEVNSRSISSKTIDGETAYRFYRRVVNGHVILKGLETNTSSDMYFIPEKMIKDMGVEDGDYLVIKSSYPGGNGIRYTFHIAETGNADNMDRLQYDYCLVHEDFSPIAESPYYVDNSFTKGSLMEYKDGEYSPLFRLYLQEGDIKKFNIKADDIISVAYWVNRPHESVRVTEVTEMESNDSTSPKPNSKSTKKATPKKDETEVDTTTYPEIVDKNVAVVGFEHFHSRYEKVLSSYGASPLLLTGDESVSQFSSTIDEADVVVFVVEMMSHHAYHEVKAYAKFKQVPHTIATKSGAGFITKLANDKLSERQ